MKLVYQPAPAARLGDFLRENLASDAWTSFRAAVAFVKRSGTKYVASPLAAFAQDRAVEVIAGINHQGTSKEGLEDLLGAVGPLGRVIIFNNPDISPPKTFHPKIYVFKSDNRAEVFIGSGNLTQGGLYTNYEASIRLEVDIEKEADRELLISIDDVLDYWSDVSIGTALLLDATLLSQLVTMGLVPVEALVPPDTDGEETAKEGGEASSQAFGSLFKAHKEPPAPATPSEAAAPSFLPTTSSAAALTGIPSERYGKKLTLSDAQRKLSGNQRGSITLVRAGYPINPQTYFRYGLFKDANWVAGQTQTGEVRETAVVSFQVEFLGNYLGILFISITYAPNRESAQTNYTTLLHLGPLAQHIAAHNVTGKWLLLDRLLDGSYSLSIRDTPP